MVNTKQLWKVMTASPIYYMIMIALTLYIGSGAGYGLYDYYYNFKCHQHLTPNAEVETETVLKCTAAMLMGYVGAFVFFVMSGIIVYSLKKGLKKL